MGKLIGATAIVYGAEVVTRDSHFLECQYKKLRVWQGEDKNDTGD